MSTTHDNLDFSGLDEEMAAVRELAGLDRLSEFDELAVVEDEPSAHAGNPSESLQKIQGDLDGLLEKERGILAFLRGRSTAQRVGLVVFGSVLATCITLLISPRAHLTGAGATRFAGVVLLTAIITIVASWRLMRPLHLPPANPMIGRALLLAGVLLPFLMALTLAHTEGREAASGIGFLKQCGGCFGFGAALGVPVLALALMLRRAKVDSAAIGALAGVAAGVTGYLTLHIHCTISDPAHIMGGHASVLLVLGSAAALWRWRESKATI